MCPYVRDIATRQFGPGDPRWQLLQMATAASVEECNFMLADLVRDFGRPSVSMLLGVPGRDLRSWQEKGVRSMVARRLVWVTWSMFRRPDRIATIWDWVTWGRFADNRRVKRAVKKLHEKTPQERKAA